MTKFNLRMLVRTTVVAIVVLVAVFAAGQWGSVQAQTVPPAGGPCEKLSALPVAVVKSSPIYYRPSLLASIPLLSITAGKTFYICTDYSGSAFTAFTFAPGYRYPLYVPKGVFAGN